MPIPRRATLWIQHLFDQWLPPILRDSRWFMSLFMNLSLGRDSRLLRDFKPLAPDFSNDEMGQYYKATAQIHIQRATDLNGPCIREICAEIAGNTVLDIACGRGFLAAKLARDYSVTAADFHIVKTLPTEHPEVNWVEANVEELPFADDQFDTVVCAHTLEHLLDPHAALVQLRRVARRKLLIVVPQQRPYQYTFDLHLHFFPYQWQLELLLRPGRSAADVRCVNLGGDWFYAESYMQQ